MVVFGRIADKKIRYVRKSELNLRDESAEMQSFVLEHAINNKRNSAHFALRYAFRAFQFRRILQRGRSHLARFEKRAMHRGRTRMERMGDEKRNECGSAHFPTSNVSSNAPPRFAAVEAHAWTSSISSIRYLRWRSRLSNRLRPSSIHRNHSANASPADLHPSVHLPATWSDWRTAHILVSNSCTRSCKSGDKWKNSWISQS